MTLNQIFYFIKAAELENFRTASLQLHISQPSLSRSMAMLEEELGVALFEKTGRGIRLTKAGKIFYDHAVKISTDYDQAIDRMAEVAGGQGKIDIGYVFPLAGHYIPSKVRLFLEKKENENVSFSFLQDHSHDIIRRLREGELDIGFGGKTDDPDLEFYPLIDQEKVVPNDIAIGKDYQAIVITGPNTGGKTITLKTLGLLQLMGQAGLPIPAGEESQIGIFEEVFADIGDEQSIEQSLSTFSSHMTNTVDILSKVNEKSLVLFDELGAGTDPQEGAALAIAILDDLGKKSAYVMATTHYPELKVYGYNRANTINASMEFDVDTLSPTYRLLIGVPGRSNAFEISSRLGLDTEVIDEAKQLMNDESQDLNEMITDLENRRKMAETEYLEMRHFVSEAQELHDDLKEAYSYFFEEREKEIEKAKKKANEVVSEAEEKAEKIIADIRKMQQQIGQGNVKEHQLIDAKTQLANLHQEETLKKNKVLKKAKEQKTLKPGDEVLVTTYGQRGTLLRKNGNQWQVEIGILKMNVSEDELTPVAPQKEPTQRVIHAVRSESSSHVPNQLDLRGKRYEEALSEVDQYLDSASLAGYPQVTIVHGKGTGALRKGITDYLKNHRSVKSFEFAPANQGGNGATIVKFK